jgi:hypothetical protein
MIYGDDQCVGCGRIRVAKSKLCANCLVKERDFLEKEVLIKKMVIEMRGKRIANLQALLKEAMAYGFKKNQENVKLHQYIRELVEKIHRGWKYGKDGQAENIEK